jgi:hypothetical protein
MLNIEGWLQSLEAENQRIMNLPTAHMMTQRFMERNTDYSNIRDFMNAYQHMRAMTGADIDTYVRCNTYFESWMDMVHTAYEETFLKQG